jgi:CBS domain-containing protein
VTYEELKSGMIEIDGNEMPTSPLSSFFMAGKVAEELKSRVERGEFLLSLPAERLSTDTVLKPMKQTKELPLVTDIMTRKVKPISESASIADAAKLIMETQCTHIPVVSEAEKLVGIVTAWDISTAVAKRHEGVSEIMTRNVMTADLDEPLELVIRKLDKYNISALPVIDRDRRVIGIVTSDEISKLIWKRKRWEWKLRI